MKQTCSPLRRRLVAVAALFLAVTGGSRADFTAAADLVPLPSNDWASHGMHRDEVVQRLGVPSEKASENCWVYWDFKARGRPGGDRPDTLVILFADDRVRLLRLTERKAVLAFLHQIRLKRVPGGSTIAQAAQ